MAKSFNNFRSSNNPQSSSTTRHAYKSPVQLVVLPKCARPTQPLLHHSHPPPSCPEPPPTNSRKRLTSRHCVTNALASVSPCCVVPLLGNIGDVALEVSRMHRHVGVERKEKPQRPCGKRRRRLPGLESEVVGGWGYLCRWGW